MIDYEYTLTRDLASDREIKRPHKELMGPLKNIFIVEGPNGKGKSLLMNIIAMSSYGYENKDVPSSLRSDMGEYLRGDTTKLSFGLTIQDPVSGKILKASHGENDKTKIELSESADGGSTFVPLSVSEFNDRYNLIYDIPENPRKRIMGIIQNVKYVQDDCKTKVRSAQEFVQDILDDIKDHSIDTDRLAEFRSAVAEYERTCKSEKERLEALKSQYETLIKFYHAKNLQALKSKTEGAKSDWGMVKRQEEAKESRPEQVMGAYTKKVNLLRNRLTAISMQINDIGQKIKATGNEKAIQHYQILKGWNVDSIISNKKIDTACYYAARDMKGCLDETEVSTDAEEVRLLETLLNELEKFKGKNLKIEGVGTVEQMIKLFETQYNEKSVGKKPKVDLTQLKSTIDAIKTSIEKISYEVSALEDPPKVPKEKQYKDQDKIDRYETKYLNAKKAEEAGYAKAKAFGVDFSNAATVIMSTDKSLRMRYEKTELSSVLDDAMEIKESYDKQSGEFNSIGQSIAKKKLKIEEWENNVESVYAPHEAAINKISDQLYKFTKRLDEMDKRFRAVENESYQGFSEDDQLFPILWRYLGRRLKTVRYDDKEYAVVEVNAMKKLVVTETIHIPMSSFSTGLNQRNYLLTKLSTEDNRPIIALFDEIGIMDPEIQEDLVRRMEKLQSEGKLIAGMLNRPAPKLKVINYGL